jgi:hypothetical protein
MLTRFFRLGELSCQYAIYAIIGISSFLTHRVIIGIGVHTALANGHIGLFASILTKFSP